MTTYYLRSGGGNWSAAATWSLTSGGGATGSTPTAADDLICDAASGSATLTVDGTSGSPSLCRSFVCTGFTGTLTYASAKQLNIGDGTAGAFLLVSGMTLNTGGALKFVSTTTGNNITFGGKNLGTSVTFDGVGGGWVFQDNANGAFTLTNGDLDTNSKSVSGTLSSSNSNTRSLTLGTTTWTINSTSGWDITTSTNMTLSAASGTITRNGTTQNDIFNFGGLSYGTISATGYTTGSCTVNQANTIATLTLNCGANTTSQFVFGANQTVSGTFTANGNSVINRAYYRSSVKGTARTITAATVTTQHSDWQDITGAGAGSWNLSAITGNSGNCGGCSGITFTTPANQYWVPSGGTSTGSESAVTRWASASNGTAGTGRSPLPQDTAYFDAFSIDAGSRTITQDKPRIGAHDWTGVTNTPAWTKNQACSFFGPITMVNGMTQSSTTAYTYEGRSNSTITFGSTTFTNSLTVDCVDGVGTLTLGDSGTSSSTLAVTSGTLSGAAKTIGFTNVTVSGGTVNVQGLLASGTHTYSGGTTTVGSSGITGTAFTNSGGTFTLNGASTGMTGNMTLSGGTTTIAANYTTSGNLAVSNDCTLNVTSATLNTATINIVGAGSGGGSGSIFSTPIIRAA